MTEPREQSSPDLEQALGAYLDAQRMTRRQLLERIAAVGAAAALAPVIAACSAGPAAGGGIRLTAQAWPPRPRPPRTPCQRSCPRTPCRRSRPADSVPGDPARRLAPRGPRHAPTRSPGSSPDHVPLACPASLRIARLAS